MENEITDAKNEAFDWDLLNSKTSRNETNHFHIYIDDDVEYRLYGNKFDASNLSDNQYGTLLHEYVHYIQHIQTLYGVNRSRMFNRLFLDYAEYLNTHNIIELPLSPDDINTGIKKPFIKLVETQGQQSYSHNVDDIEIIEENIEEARAKRKFVEIPVYDFSANEILEGGKSYHFGYWAIIEGMAHHIQKLIDPTVEESHAVVPYRIIDKIWEMIYPERKDDTKLLISICFISLMFDNPGVGFFDVSNFARQHGIDNGRSLYKDSLLHTVRFKGKTITIQQFLIYLHEQMLNELSILVGHKMDYYGKVYKQMEQELNTGESTLLNLVYSDEIKDKSKFSDILLEVYGLPVIESHMSSLLQTNPETGKPYEEIAGLAAWELLYKRITCKTSTICNRYSLCIGSEKMSPECRDAQWLKEEKCVMTEAFRIYGKNVGEWRQTNI